MENMLTPAEKVDLLDLNVDQTIPHLSRNVDLWFFFEAEPVLPISLDPPVDGGNHSFHPRDTKPAALSHQMFSGGQIVREPGPLPLKSSLGQDDSVLRVDDERFPYITQSDGMPISQLEGVPGSNKF